MLVEHIFSSLCNKVYYKLHIMANILVLDFDIAQSRNEIILHLSRVSFFLADKKLFAALKKT